MIHKESFIVTKTNGPRPAGKPGHCFYCGIHVGHEHAKNCICRKRTIIMKAEIEVLMEMGEDPNIYTEAYINHKFDGEGTYCMDNIIEMIETARGDSCLCGNAKMTYLREASEKDEKRHNYESENF